MDLKIFDSFFDRFFELITEFGIDISNYELDHIAYQSSSTSDYEKLKPQFMSLGEQVSEAVVGGRRVGIFKLNEPYKYNDYSIPAVELIEPKSNQACPSAPEHAEFVLNETFDEFLEKYPQIEWDISSIDQPVFPMIKLKLADHMQVKFHYKPVLEIVKETEA